MNYLTLEDILRLHFDVIESFGGLHGVRDEGRLLSVIHTPQQDVFGAEQYSELYDKAAVYMRNIIGDHPFHDGNKRTGVAVGVTFLIMNSAILIATPKELEDFAVSIATDQLDVPAIATWLKEHSQIN